MAKPALGRGLGALLSGSPATSKAASLSGPATSSSSPDLSTPNANEQVRRIPIHRIQPCPFQPRKDFAPEALRELADSIKEQGVVQPLIVRAKGDSFELIAGERRWRAAQLVGLTDLPVLVREADDASVLELALIENLQRENLNPLEEALGYSQLIEQFRLTQEEAALKVGKSRAAVANALRLLRLPQDVQHLLRDGQLSVGHAKVLLSLSSAADQKIAAQQILKDGLNVRQTEQLIARIQERSSSNHSTPTVPASPRDPHVADIENRLQQKLGTKTLLRYRQGKGSIEIRFFNDDELERILALLGLPPD